MITVNVNQEEHKILEDNSLLIVVTDLKIATNGIAIAVNESIIKKEDWSKHVLQNNDNILIIKATQGG